MRLSLLLTPTLLAASAAAGPWKFRRADPAPSPSASTFPPAPIPRPQVPGQYCPSFGYSYRCSSDAECPSNARCVSGPYLNETNIDNCAGTCSLVEDAPALPQCPYADGVQTCRSDGCGIYQACVRTGLIESDRDACSGRCGAVYLGGCPRPNGSGGTICGTDADCEAGSRCAYQTRTGDGCSGICTKTDEPSSISSDSATSSSTSTTSDTLSTSDASSTSGSTPTASSTSAPIPTGNYCGNFAFDQICTSTIECGTGYECRPRAENGTTTENCSGVCRYVNATQLPSCGYDASSGIQQCRSGAECGIYQTCLKSGPISADRNACVGKCGQGDFGPCPRDNEDGSRSCNLDSQCGFTQRCGPGTRGVPCSGTCTELPRCKTDADCNPDIYTSYGVCAPNGVCYSFNDCRADRKSCPGGVCGNNSPNATDYQDGFANRTIPFVCIFNDTSSSSSSITNSIISTGTVSKSDVASTGTVAPTSDVHPPPASSEHPKPTSDGSSKPMPGPTASDKAPEPTSDGGKPIPSSDTHPNPTSDGAKPAPSSDAQAPTSEGHRSAPSSDSHPAPTSDDHTPASPSDVRPTSKNDGPDVKPTPAPWTNNPVPPTSTKVDDNHPAHSPSASGVPVPVIPVMCMGLADIAQMLKEIKEDIAMIKIDIAAIKAKEEL